MRTTTKRKKPPEGEPQITFRLSNEDKETLDKILTSLDCTWGGNPSVGQLVRNVLRGDIILIKK